MTRRDRSHWFSLRPLPRVVGCGALIILVVVLVFGACASNAQERSGRRDIEPVSQASEPFDLGSFDDDPLAPHETFQPPEPSQFSTGRVPLKSSSRSPMPLKPPSEAFEWSRANAGRKSHSSASKPLATVSWGTTMFSLAVITGLIVLCVWVMKKIQPHKAQSLSTDIMEVLGQRPLDTRQQIYLIRCGSRILVVGVSPGGMSTLAEINDPAEIDTLIGLCRRPTEDNKLVQSFQTLLSRSNWWQNAAAVKAK